MCLPSDQASLCVTCKRLHDSIGAVADPDDVEDAASQTEDVSEQEGTNGGSGSGVASAQPGDVSMADADPSPAVPGDHAVIVQLYFCHSKAHTLCSQTVSSLCRSMRNCCCGCFERPAPLTCRVDGCHL